MNEAFRNAARKDPRNPVSRDIFDAADQARSEARQKAQRQELIRLRENFFQNGQDWLNDRRYWNGALAHRVIEKWKRDFGALLRRTQDEQAELLARFAQGLQLEENEPTVTQRIVMSALARLPRKQQQITQVSSTLIHVFSDIQRYPKGTEDEISIFIEAEQSTHGQVTLNRTIAGLTHWIAANHSIPPRST